MKKIITAILLIVSIAILVVASINGPANSDVFGGSVRHYSPDGGFDDPIQVYCDGRWRGVKEGQHSDWICNDEDVEKMRVRNTGENIRCKDGLGWFERLDGDEQLVSPVSNFQNLICVMDLD